MDHLSTFKMKEATLDYAVAKLEEKTSDLSSKDYKALRRISTYKLDNDLSHLSESTPPSERQDFTYRHNSLLKDLFDLKERLTKDNLKVHGFLSFRFAVEEMDAYANGLKTPLSCIYTQFGVYSPKEVNIIPSKMFQTDKAMKDRDPRLTHSDGRCAPTPIFRDVLTYTMKPKDSFDNPWDTAILNALKTMY